MVGVNGAPSGVRRDRALGATSSIEWRSRSDRGPIWRRCSRWAPARSAGWVAWAPARSAGWLAWAPARSAGWVAWAPARSAGWVAWAPARSAGWVAWAPARSAGGVATTWRAAEGGSPRRGEPVLRREGQDVAARGDLPQRALLQGRRARRGAGQAARPADREPGQAALLGAQAHVRGGGAAHDRRELRAELRRSQGREADRPGARAGGSGPGAR